MGILRNERMVYNCRKKFDKMFSHAHDIIPVCLRWICVLDYLRTLLECRKTRIPDHMKIFHCEKFQTHKSRGNKACSEHWHTHHPDLTVTILCCFAYTPHL